MSDLDDLLGDKPSSAEPVRDVEEVQPEPEPQEAEGQEAAESEPAPEAEDAEQPKSVPHERFHAVNQRAKELEAELEKLRAEAPATPRRAPDLSHLFVSGADDKLPDPMDDPQGYQQAIEQRFNDRLYQQGWQVSETAARRHYGADAVDEALSAFGDASKANPLLQQAAKQSADPVGEIVNWHKQQQAMQAIAQAGGLDAYREQIAKQIREELSQGSPETQPAVQAAQPTTAMPSDLATARSAAPRDGGFQPADLNSLLG